MPTIANEDLIDRSKARVRGIKHKASWSRFLRERHLLILEWAHKGMSPITVANQLSMSAEQVNEISKLPAPDGEDRYEVI